MNLISTTTTHTLHYSYRHTTVCLRLLVREVAHGPGQVVSGHARGTGKAVGHPAVLVSQNTAFHWHVGQRGVLRVMTEHQGKRGLVDRFVKAGEGLPRMNWAELGHCQVTV